MYIDDAQTYVAVHRSMLRRTCCTSKYIIISYAFLAVFWGGAVSRLFHWKGAVGKILSLILALSLTITGIYDFAVILKDNDSGHRVSVNLNSGLTSWLAENLKKDDLILTPEYSINEVTMSGVMMYLGWLIMHGPQAMTLITGCQGSRNLYNSQRTGTKENS